MVKPTIENILKEIRLEFIGSTSERLTVVDDLISSMINEDCEIDETLIEFQRHIHSIKGQGATFDFPTVSTVAHRLEDYIETAPALRNKQLLDMQTFVDVIRQIIESGDDPSETDTKTILNDLPVTTAVSTATISEQSKLRVVRILLVMDKGTQRRIIGKELVSCGFYVSNADTPLIGIGEALAHPPDIIIVNGVMKEMSGLEFAKTMSVLKTTQKCRIVVATATDFSKADLETCPKETAIVKKGSNFSEDLTEYLIDWGYFGDIGNPTATT